MKIKGIFSRQPFIFLMFGESYDDDDEYFNESRGPRSGADFMQLDVRCTCEETQISRKSETNLMRTCETNPADGNS